MAGRAKTAEHLPFHASSSPEPLGIKPLYPHSIMSDAQPLERRQSRSDGREVG